MLTMVVLHSFMFIQALFGLKYIFHLIILLKINKYMPKVAMKKKQLQKRIEFFQTLNGLSKKDKFQYIQNCPDAMIDIISEACFNILKLNTLRNQAKVTKKVKLLDNDIKTLSSKANTVESRRNLLKRELIGKEVFSLLSTAVLPELQDQYSKK